jgi:hypothetical protein
VSEAPVTVGTAGMALVRRLRAADGSISAEGARVVAVVFEAAQEEARALLFAVDSLEGAMSMMRRYVRQAKAPPNDRSAAQMREQVLQLLEAHVDIRAERERGLAEIRTRSYSAALGHELAPVVDHPSSLPVEVLDEAVGKAAKVDFPGQVPEGDALDALRRLVDDLIGEGRR